jgi:DMSO/TMAO reductase YedYZ heme-binding membrane subunit
MKKFIIFFIIWVSQNLAIPFWIVGHIHLTLNVYADIKEIFASVGMNLIVIVGFILDYRNSLKDDRTRDTEEKNKAT